MLCPHCHEESFAKKKLQRDGWNITGEVEVCALCGKIWHEKHGKKSGSPENSAEDERRRRLSALLGGEEPGKIKLAGVLFVHIPGTVGFNTVTAHGF